MALCTVLVIVSINVRYVAARVVTCGKQSWKKMRRRPAVTCTSCPRAACTAERTMPCRSGHDSAWKSADKLPVVVSFSFIVVVVCKSGRGNNGPAAAAAAAAAAVHAVAAHSRTSMARRTWTLPDLASDLLAS